MPGIIYRGHPPIGRIYHRDHSRGPRWPFVRGPRISRYTPARLHQILGEYFACFLQPESGAWTLTPSWRENVHVLSHAASLHRGTLSKKRPWRYLLKKGGTWTLIPFIGWILFRKIHSKACCPPEAQLPAASQHHNPPWKTVLLVMKSKVQEGIASAVM